MNQNRLTDQQRQGMSERINQIVQLKFRESQNQQFKGSSNYNSQGLKENSASKSGSKQNIWCNPSKNQAYYNNEQNSGQKQGNRVSRIKIAQQRIGSSSSQVSVKREKSLGSYEQSDSFNAGVSINSSITTSTKQPKPNSIQQFQYFDLSRKPQAMSLLQQQQPPQNFSKNFFSPNAQLVAYNSTNVHPYAKIVHTSKKPSFVNNFINAKQENITEPEEIINMSQQQQQFDLQPEDNLYIEQIKIQELRIAQLEELLKQETLNCEQYRSQISILKQQMLKSVSESGLVSLFEEAYIASIDKQIDVIVLLKEIQQKIEQDVSSSQSIIIGKDNNLKELIEQNQALQNQVNEYFALNEQLSEEFQSNLENKKQNDQEKFYLIESNNKLVHDIENAIKQNTVLIEENRHYLKQFEEKNTIISQLETLLKDQNENKSELEAVSEEKEQIIQKQAQDIFELNEEIKELKYQNDGFECVLREYEEQVQELREQQKESKLQSSHEKRNKKREEELEEQRKTKALEEEEMEKQFQFQAIQTNINNLEQQVDSLEQKNNLLSQQIEKNQSSISQKDKQILEKDKILKKKDEQIHKSESEAKQLQNMIQELQIKIQEQQNKISEQQKTIEMSQKQLDTAQKSIEAAQKQVQEQKHINQGLHQKEEVMNIIQENKTLNANLQELQGQFEQLKQQNVITINANAQLQQLVEQNQILLKQANSELARKNESTSISPQILQEYDKNFEELNNKVIELHQKYQESEEEREKQIEEIAILKNELENDDKLEQIQYMQLKSNFFSTQVIIMSKILKIIDEEDECIEQDQYEPIVIQIKERIEELLKENQQLQASLQELKENDKEEQISQASQIQAKISQLQSLENSFNEAKSSKQNNVEPNQNIQSNNTPLGEIQEEEQQDMNQFNERYEKQIEEMSQQLQDLQIKLAEVYEQKYILETYISQIKEFVPNEEVQELISKYCETISELITNEHCQKRLKENIQELEQSENEKEEEQQNGEVSERSSNIQQLMEAFQQILGQHQDLIQNRDEIGQQIVFFSQKENEKYFMIQELQQQNQQLYEELLKYQQSEHSMNGNSNSEHLADQQGLHQESNYRLNQYYNNQDIEEMAANEEIDDEQNGEEQDLDPDQYEQNYE